MASYLADSYDNPKCPDDTKNKQKDKMPDFDWKCLEIKDLVSKFYYEKGWGGEHLLKTWFTMLQHKKPYSFDTFLSCSNRNRFANVICYDRNRVILKDDLGSKDYYHASYVDSFDKADGYIMAQAPFTPQTENDFWRMVVLTKPSIIILLAELGDRAQAVRCFWPMEKDTASYCEEGIKVVTLNKEEQRSHFLFEIKVSCKKKEAFRTELVMYKEWKDDCPVPPSLTDFRAEVEMICARADKTPERATGPRMLVCPSGSTRCGTFAGLDIVMRRIMAERRVGINETIKILLSQRYGVFHFLDHYQFLNETILRQCVTLGLADMKAIGAKKKKK